MKTNSDLHPKDSNKDCECIWLLNHRHINWLPEFHYSGTNSELMRTRNAAATLSRNTQALIYQKEYWRVIAVFMPLMGSFLDYGSLPCLKLRWKGILPSWSGARSLDADIHKIQSHMLLLNWIISIDNETSEIQRSLFAVWMLPHTIFLLRSSLIDLPELAISTILRFYTFVVRISMYVEMKLKRHWMPNRNAALLSCFCSSSKYHTSKI